MNRHSESIQPNIVLIVLDSVRRDHLSCYGYSRQTTPHIDRLASEGVLFEHAYATSCWTIPAHASLFTGLYPSQHRADFDTRYLQEQHRTLAQELAAAGYSTACISCNSFVGGGFTNLNQGFDLTVDVEGGVWSGPGWAGRALRAAHKRWRRLRRRDRGADQATRLARRWLEQQQQPFFLFINYMDCHLPYRLRRPARYRFVASEERARVDALPLDPFAAMAGALTLSPQQVRDLQALYDGCLFYLDAQVGRLVVRLKQLGLYEETLFIVTSDHGESFGEHGLFDHQYGLFEHLVATPFIVRLPHGEERGWRNPALFQHVDLMPALLQVAGGGSVDRLLEPGRQAVLTEYLVPNLRQFHRRFPDMDVAPFDSPQRAILRDGYKLIVRRDGATALYDLAQDQGETQDMAATRPALAQWLRDELAAQLGPWPEPASRETQPAAETEELQERLKALGYL
jgi:arylsulfatase A-like enzyme